jgi:hypothetical protein
MRTPTRRELNRALLARQLLLGRAPLGLPAPLEQLCGIQAQYAPSMYFGLWSLEPADGFSAEPFERVPAAAMRAVRAEGERVAAAFD